MQYVCLGFVMSRLLYVMENNLFQKGKISAKLLLLFQVVSQFLYPFGRMHAHIQGNHRNTWLNPFINILKGMHR